MPNLRKLQEITIDEQKKLLVEIMDYVHHFCRRNQIQYFAVGGTLIGAIRHKGYIPWDDDIDIAMPRKDYDRFLELFPQENQGRYQLECIEQDLRYYLPYAKVVDTETLLKERVHGIKTIGVNIDIFPMDFITEETKENVEAIFKRSRLESLIYWKSECLSRENSFVKNLALVAARIICPIPFRYTAHCLKKREKYAADHETPWILCLYGGFGPKGVATAEYFREFMEVPFENIRIMAPVRYDDYLRNLFGDYMTPPPKEKQVSHHNYIAVWKNKKRKQQ